MNQRKPASLTKSRAALLMTAGLFALTAGPAAADFRESFTFEGRSLVVGNLIGTVAVEGTSGRNFEVEVHVQGKDGTRDNVRFERQPGATSRLTVRFPTDRSNRYVYPALGRGKTSISLRDGDSRGWLGELIHTITGDRIKVAGSGAGLEVWADVVVRVPRGHELEIDHGVGKISAVGVEGDIDLELASGGVSADRMFGDIDIDTGSGTVELSEIQGELVVNTGSGGVRVQGFDGDELEIDTGSGTVALEDVSCDRLLVDTGSGGVKAQGVRANSASIDTGSGSVVLALVEMGDGSFDIDTGSGSITLLVPGHVSAEFEADTGSGGIEVALASFKTQHKERDEMRFSVGSGGARVRLDTGSGRIRVAEAN